MHYGPQDDDSDTRRTGPGLGGPVEPAPKRRRRRWPYAVAAVVVVLAGGATAAWALNRDTAPAEVPTLTIAGELETPDRSLGLTNGLPCEVGPGYEDVKAGAQITVTDEAGKVIGLGQLGAGLTSIIENVNGTGRTSWLCEFHFSVPNIPGGHQFYGIELAHRGVVRFTPDQIESGKVKLSLGT